MADSARLVVKVLFLSLVGGCATEGVILSTHRIVNQGLATHGTLPDAQVSEMQDADKGERSQVSRLIAVGAVSNLREITKEDLDEFYDDYATSFETWEADKGPVVTRDEFSRLYTGWTRVMVGRGVLSSKYITVLVTPRIADEVKFEHPFRVLVDQSTGDLVAAITNADGAFVIEKLLCREDEQYAVCIENYKLGIFDATTGIEIDLKADDKLILKEDGQAIDTATFLPMP